ncbi:MAG: ferritin-like domain-containing protein [Vicinamibacterales bacterium]
MAGAGTLHDAFIDELRDTYDAERQLIKGLGKLAKTATNPELRDAFETHLQETQGQVERLEQVFASLDEKPRGKHCDGIAGILDEGKSIMSEDFDDVTMDACLIAAAQRAEHYENRRIRNAHRVGARHGARRCCRTSGRDARRGEGGRREAHVACRGRHQSRGGRPRASGEEWRRGRGFRTDEGISQERATPLNRVGLCGERPSSPAEAGHYERYRLRMSPDGVLQFDAIPIVRRLTRCSTRHQAADSMQYPSSDEMTRCSAAFRRADE